MKPTLAMGSALVEGNIEVRAFVLCCTLLCLKLLAMAALIGKTRLNKEIFISPEDTVRRGKVSYEDPDIERLRRAHLNDLENIPVFVVSGVLFLLCRPWAGVAVVAFLVYTAARLAHTYVYAVEVLPQPARRIAFQAGYLTNLLMLFYTLAHTALS